MQKQEAYGVRATAVLTGYSAKWLRELLWAERVPGAKKVGREWQIPAAFVEALRKRNAGNRQVTEE